MFGIFKSLGKRKIFNILIMLQLSISLLYFFVCAASIQQVFYTNIKVPKELNSNPEQIVHLEIQTQDVNAENFEKFSNEVKNNISNCLGTYRNSSMYLDTWGEDVGTVEVSDDIREIKEIYVAKGRYFDKDDFNPKKMKGTKKKPISILIGQDIVESSNLELGQVICNDETEEYYRIVGILKKGSKWFYQMISDGLILSLDNQIVMPQLSKESVNLHYYCIVPENKGIDRVRREILNLALKNDITLQANLVSNELDKQFEKNLAENRQWMMFAIVILIMVSIGTTMLVVAHLYSRQTEIGIRMSVGYPIRKIMFLLIGEVISIAIISLILALATAGLVIGNNVEYLSGAEYSTGYYLSTEIVLIGMVILLIICIPSIIILEVRTRKLQPKDLIGGKE
jgi:hypothetical protein